MGAVDEAGRSVLDHVVVEHRERLADGGPLVLEVGVVTVTGRSPIA